MKYLFVLSFLLFVTTLMGQSAKLGVFTTSADIGKPKIAGSATYDATAKVYTIKGAGYNIWFNRDEFHYLYNKMQGDFVITGDFEFVGDTTGSNGHRKFGWMVRETEDESSVSMNAVQHGDGLVVMQWRGEQGANMRDPEDEIFFPTKKVFKTIQLERKGDNFTMRIGNPGQPLQLVGTQQLKMPASVLAGAFICSHDENKMEEARISNVKIEKTKKK